MSCPDMPDKSRCRQLCASAGRMSSMTRRACRVFMKPVPRGAVKTTPDRAFASRAKEHSGFSATWQAALCSSSRRLINEGI